LFLQYILQYIYFHPLGMSTIPAFAIKQFNLAPHPLAKITQVHAEFYHQASVMRLLGCHENIVQLEDVATEPWRATALYPHQLSVTGYALTLRTALKTAASFISAPTGREHIMRSALAGLAHLHAHGVIHGNLSLDSIFVNENGTKVALGDFENAHVLTGGSHLIKTSKAGVVYHAHPKGHNWYPSGFRAPELLLGQVGDIEDWLLSPKCDIWALGVILCSLWLEVEENPFLLSQQNNLSPLQQLALIFSMIGSPIRTVHTNEIGCSFPLFFEADLPTLPPGLEHWRKSTIPEHDRPWSPLLAMLRDRMKNLRATATLSGMLAYHAANRPHAIEAIHWLDESNVLLFQNPLPSLVTSLAFRAPAPQQFERSFPKSNLVQQLTAWDSIAQVACRDQIIRLRVLIAAIYLAYSKPWEEDIHVAAKASFQLARAVWNYDIQPPPARMEYSGNTEEDSADSVEDARIERAVWQLLVTLDFQVHQATPFDFWEHDARSFTAAVLAKRRQPMNQGIIVQLEHSLLLLVTLTPQLRQRYFTQPGRLFREVVRPLAKGMVGSLPHILLFSTKDVYDILRVLKIARNHRMEGLLGLLSATNAHIENVAGFQFKLEAIRRRMEERDESSDSTKRKLSSEEYVSETDERAVRRHMRRKYKNFLY
jgi:serine/threonine protein kinase